MSRSIWDTFKNSGLVTRKAKFVLKLVAGVGTVPLFAIGLGYKMRIVQAAEMKTIGARHVYRACDLPLYPVTYTEELQSDVHVPYPRNLVEKGIGSVRRAVQDRFEQFADSYNNMRTSSMASFVNSRATLLNLLSSPVELSKVTFITLAGLAGCVFGSRGGTIKKVLYGSLAAGSSAAACYPKEFIKLNKSVRDYIRQLQKPKAKRSIYFKDERPWVTEESSSSHLSDGPLAEIFNQSGLVLEADIDQSNPEDKDLYTTRSS